MGVRRESILMRAACVNRGTFTLGQEIRPLYRTGCTLLHGWWPGHYIPEASCKYHRGKARLYPYLCASGESDTRVSKRRQRETKGHMGHDNVKEIWSQLKGEPQYEDTEEMMGKENLLNYPLVEDTILYPIPYMLTS